MEFRTPYNLDKFPADPGLVIPEDEPVLTQQHFRQECDINEIVRRFGITGELPEPWAAPRYGDFTQVTDFHSAQNMVLEAQAAFDALPAELRERFGHDPQALLEFLDDGGNRAEAIELGLIPKPKEELQDAPPPKAD